MKTKTHRKISKKDFRKLLAHFLLRVGYSPESSIKIERGTAH